MTLEQTMQRLHQLSRALAPGSDWPRLYSDGQLCWVSVPRATGLNSCAAKPTFLEAATEVLEELRQEALARAELLTKAAG